MSSQSHYLRFQAEVLLLVATKLAVFMSKKIKIKYVHSPIGRDKTQKETIRCLGLSRLNQVKEVIDNEPIRGMLRKVSHLVQIIEN